MIIHNAAVTGMQKIYCSHSDEFVGLDISCRRRDAHSMYALDVLSDECSEPVMMKHYAGSQ
jgi:hypothetical protein